ncbi:MAG TPA: cation:dicarboxylase symporter family transporter [Holophagaceae bacterium]|nr:cation:dicarboxylase symporter family transporter [Holophagaceae bacterium]
MQQGKPWYRSSTLWIFAGLILGVVLGGFLPKDLHPVAWDLFHFLSMGFIALIKGLIVPLLFSTIVVGIAQTGDLKAVGRMGGKALLYFEIVTTLALFIGLTIANLVKPGAHLPLNLGAHSGVTPAQPLSGWDMAMHLFPSNLAKHAAEGDILPVVVFAALFGIALTRTGEKGRPVLAFFEGVAQTMFKYTDMVMLLTPIGVFGSMAFNVSGMAAGQEVGGVMLKGWTAVFHLLKQYSLLVGSLYLALLCLFAFVFVPILWICGVRVLGFLKAVEDPALTAFSTASSEAALPKLLEETVAFGVPRSVAAFVIPTGYSFNLDGSTLYLVLASLAIAQAAHIQMGLGQQIVMALVFMVASKGIAGVPRGTLVIIQGTCASFGLPADAGVAMLLAVDAVMDMGRTTINVVGNGLASVVIAKWEGVFGSETA